MTNLRGLVISSDRINDKQIGYLSGSELRSLGLLNCPLTDAAFEAVGKMTKLTNLEVCALPITDVGLGKLPSSLATLSLYACTKISDAALIALASRPQLRELNLYRCPNITINAIAHFARTEIKVGWHEPSASLAAAHLDLYDVGSGQSLNLETAVGSGRKAQSFEP